MMLNACTLGQHVLFSETVTPNMDVNTRVGGKEAMRERRGVEGEVGNEGEGEGARERERERFRSIDICRVLF